MEEAVIWQRLSNIEGLLGLNKTNYTSNQPRILSSSFLRHPQLVSQRCLATSHDAPTARNVDLTSRTPPYPLLLSRLSEVRRVLSSSRHLTLAEKILYSHLENPEESLLSGTNGGRDVRGQANLKLKPDRVAMQDASAQMALLQFMSCGLPSTAVPASIHCDHMIIVGLPFSYCICLVLGSNNVLNRSSRCLSFVGPLDHLGQCMEHHR